MSIPYSVGFLMSTLIYRYTIIILVVFMRILDFGTYIWGCLWRYFIWVSHEHAHINAFQKDWFDKFVLNSTKYWKNRPQKPMKQNILYLTWKVGFLYYFTVHVKHIHGQFKTYLKLQKIHSKTLPKLSQLLSAIPPPRTFQLHGLAANQLAEIHRKWPF
jgi:hypothetical protein